jgi:hypothetical protein
MSMLLLQSARGFTKRLPTLSDLTKTCANVGTSEVGYRLELDGDIATGCGTGAGPSYSDVANWVNVKAGLDSTEFEYKWVTVTRDNANVTWSEPVAENTFQTLETGGKVFEGDTTAAGAVRSWVFDLTIREIADTANTDTNRITLNTEDTT